MISFEYKVVPAPHRPERARGVRGTDARFALSMERVMNEMAEGGWEYQRTDTLPCEERQGLGGTSLSYKTMLIFRRARPEDVAAFQPRQIEAQAPPPALPAAETAPQPRPARQEALAPEAPERIEDRPTATGSDAPKPRLSDALRPRRTGLSVVAPQTDPAPEPAQCTEPALEDMLADPDPMLAAPFEPLAPPQAPAAPARSRARAWIEAPGPALLARARQIARRDTSDVAAE